MDYGIRSMMATSPERGAPDVTTRLDPDVPTSPEYDRCAPKTRAE